MAKNDTTTKAETVDPADSPSEPTTTIEPDAERAPMAELSSIRFNSGSVDIRVISAFGLRSVGVEPKSEDDLVWSRDNDFSLPISAVNAATVDLLISLPGFSAV